VASSDCSPDPVAYLSLATPFWLVKNPRFFHVCPIRDKLISFKHLDDKAQDMCEAKHMSLEAFASQSQNTK
jgi:hypothetical protein